MIREIESINVVAPYTSRWQKPRTTDEVETLITFAVNWQEHFENVADDRGITVNTKEPVIERVDLVRELPTDLIVYFLDTLEDNTIVLDIARIVSDGRVHLIQIITLDDLPTHLECYEHMFRFPLHCKREGRIIVPIVDGPTGDEFIRADSLNTYGRNPQAIRRNVELLCRRLIQRIESSNETGWN